MPINVSAPVPSRFASALAGGSPLLARWPPSAASCPSGQLQAEDEEQRREAELRTAQERREEA